MKVTKRNGNVVFYDDEKVVQSILRANENIPGEEITERTAAYIAGVVFARLSAEDDLFTTADVRDCVYRTLQEKDYFLTAQNYMTYSK